jgi:parvulin-like peptidyl-prolyl isomerase
MDIRRKDDGSTNDAQTQPAPNQSGGGSGIMGTVLIVLGLIALIALGFYLADKSDKTETFSDSVAVVNGEEISGEELSRQLESFRSSTSTQAQQFNNLSATRQQEILLEGIINARLQLQVAQAAGVTVSDEAVETQLADRVAQIGEAEFENRLEANDVTRADVKEDLRNQLIINNYIEQQAGGEITATEQEVQALYQQYSTQLQQASGTTTAAVPELAQLRPQIEATVVQQKRQQIASEALAEARASAEIEILLEGVNYPASTSTAPVTSQPTNNEPAPTTTPQN